MNEYRRAREELGLSMRALSFQSGVDVRNIKRLEEGGKVRASTVARLRSYLRLPMGEVNPLVALMEERQVSVPELAEQINVSSHQVWNWRVGAGRIPRRHAVRISEILRARPGHLDPITSADTLSTDSMREALRADNRSVREIAAATGLSPCTVQQIKSGVRKRTSIDVVRAIIHEEGT